MDKRKLRIEFKSIREGIKGKSLKSKIIMEKVIQSEFYKEARVIALYSSLPSEVDTVWLIAKSIKDKKVVVLPKVVNKSELKFYSISKLEELEKVGAFGIKEPVEIGDKFVDKDKIDLMIVPGICFDRNKNRIGFGKGFYDRYLADAKNIFKLGICFQEQVLEYNYIITDEYDVKMDIVLTDKEIY